MARGHPRLSPEAKAAKKAQKEAANAQNLAADALLCFPADREKLKEEFIDIPAQLAAEKAEAASAASAHEKRLAELYKAGGKARSWFRQALAMKNGHRQREIRQFLFLVREFNLDNQLDLFNEAAAPGGASPEDANSGAVFDQTNAGEHVGAERGDDPGRANKRRGPPAPPAATTPNVGVEGLAAGIKPLETPEEKRARIDAQKSADAAVFDKVAKKGAATAEGPASKVETMDADTKNMTPAQKRAHAKKIADEVFERQGSKGLGPGAIH